MAELQIVLAQKKKNSMAQQIDHGYAVKLSAADKVELCDAETGEFYGVAIADIPILADGFIGVIGTYSCVAGGAVTAGQRVGPNAHGQFVHAATDGQTVAGVAEEKADKAGDVFEVTLGVGITLSQPPPQPRGGGGKRRPRGGRKA